MDALGESEGVTIGLENRAKVEARLAALEGGVVKRISGTGKGEATAKKIDLAASNGASYNDSADVTMGKDGDASEAKKEKKKKKKKTDKKEKSETKEKKKSKKEKRYFEEDAEEDSSEKKKTKKKKRKLDDESSEKKTKKKKKKSKE